MRALIKYSAATGLGWLIAGMTVLPLNHAAAESTSASQADSRLEQLLALHDLRSALHAPAAVQTKCGKAASEEER